MTLAGLSRWCIFSTAAAVAAAAVASSEQQCQASKRAHFIIPDGSLVLNPEQIGSAPIFCSRAGLNQSPRRGRRRAEAREVTRLPP